MSLVSSIQRLIDRFGRKDPDDKVVDPVTSGSDASKSLGKQGRPDEDEFGRLDEPPSGG